MSRVHFGRKSRLSALALQEALNIAGYTGIDINYGLGHSPEALNKPSAIENACNKRLALDVMHDANVPIPNLWVDVDLDTPSPIAPESAWPMIGRPDHHSKGRGFWMCRNYEDVQRALRGTRIKQAATHFLQYIEGAREFRVHVLRDARLCIRESLHDITSTCNNCKYRTIKISEKIGEIDTTHPNRNHDNNIVFNYTDISDRDRRSLRKAARQAVKSLDLDFGAVDLLLKSSVNPSGGTVTNVYVLEVNTAPRLTDETSDTLTKYVEGFMRYWND